ncbi:conserved hypothetical protein [Leishmania mexicana MHOM/GT/2001/U1103]|uniref:Uncharacterized protein n=1 Tax=Leishmania mexicana (strain MHOM/GT/2001/U1103) TaxID=929439 RepID=E9AW06_LEIMU|nr:conserved hypothetical protein [Leishmania mexicana MHOM/GT/2001/U1103]CBZ27140.1 conserved hypothetical protein [Leishmania mexicana MHOM/GT/2001/U1103]
MLRCVSRRLWYQLKDLKSKVILEKLRNSKLKEGVHPSDMDMEELARESGIAPASSVNVQDFVHEKEAVLGMLQEQRLRRIARREAFLEWQAGQREKGAAHRLVRQSRKAEKYKRRHYHATSGRMLPISLSPGEAPPDRRTPMPMPMPKACVSSTDFLRGGPAENRHAIHLSLGKK